MTYRDSLAGLRGQVLVKRAALDSRAREVTGVLRALLPEQLARNVSELEARVQTEAATPASLEKLDSLGMLTTVDALLDAILFAYDQAIAMSADVRACSDEVGDPKPPYMPQPWLIEENDQLTYKAALNARLADIVDGDERVLRWGDRGYVARFSHAGVRFLFFTDIDFVTDESSVTYACMLRINVPNALARLELHIERPHHSLGQAIGLVKEIEMGDAAFDSKFWIKGAKPTAALLVPPVRRALLAMNPRRLALVVGSGFATLSWRIRIFDSGGADALPDSAIETLVALREAIARA
jgi:hypothetical protein